MNIGISVKYILYFIIFIFYIFIILYFHSIKMKI